MARGVLKFLIYEIRFWLGNFIWVFRGGEGVCGWDINLFWL
jgi:hypothetical protein